MKSLTPVLVALALLLSSAVSDARPRPSRVSKSFRANKTFGLGLMLGAPSGISGKYYLTSDTAFDFGVGAYHRFGHRDGLHVHADFLWHPVSLVSAPAFELPLYFGIGGRVWDHGTYRNDYRDHTHLGVRAPLGLIFDFNRIPLDIFFELALVIDVAVDDDHGYSDINGALGARYYF